MFITDLQPEALEKKIVQKKAMWRKLLVVCIPFDN